MLPHSFSRVLRRSIKKVRKSRKQSEEITDRTAIRKVIMEKKLNKSFVGEHGITIGQGE